MIEPQSFEDIAERVDTQRKRIRKGEEAVGSWVVQPSNNTIQHTSSKNFEINLDRVTTREDAFEQIERAGGKNEQWMTSADVGDLVRLFQWLDLIR